MAANKEAFDQELRENVAAGLNGDVITEEESLVRIAAIESGPQRITLHRIPWALYVALRDATEGQGIRMTYLDGTLEITQSSPAPEQWSERFLGSLGAWDEDLLSAPAEPNPELIAMLKRIPPWEP